MRINDGICISFFCTGLNRAVGSSVVFVYFLFVGHKVALEGKTLVANITDLVLDALVNTGNVSLQVFGQYEGLGALLTLVLPHPLVGLGNVPVEIPLVGDSPVAFGTLYALPVDAGAVPLQSS